MQIYIIILKSSLIIKKNIYIYIYIYITNQPYKPIKIYKIITHNIAFCITNIWSDPKSIWYYEINEKEPFTLNINNKKIKGL